MYFKLNDNSIQLYTFVFFNLSYENFTRYICVFKNLVHTHHKRKKYNQNKGSCITPFRKSSSTQRDHIPQ